MTEEKKPFSANEWMEVHWQLVEQARLRDPKIPFPIRYQQALKELAQPVA